MFFRITHSLIVAMVVGIPLIPFGILLDYNFPWFRFVMAVMGIVALLADWIGVRYLGKRWSEPLLPPL